MPTVPQYSEVQFGFDVRTGSAVDRRLLLTAREMEEGRVKWQQKTDGSYTFIPLDDIMPEIYIAQCSDDMKLYIYDKNSTGISGRYNYGKFTLLSKVVDVVATDKLDSEGNELSLVDANGVVHLYSGAEEEITFIKHFINNTLVPAVNELNEQVATKASLEQLDTEVGRASDAERDLQNQISVLGDGPYIPSDWVSKYDVGGVAQYQGFAKGTSLIEIVRQILCGDPREDGIIFYTIADELPTYMVDIPWTNSLSTRSDLAANGFELDHQILNNQMLLVALPRAMVKNAAEESGRTENPVELKYIYAPAYQEFKYDWSYIDIKREMVSSEWGYRVYFPCHRDAEGKAVPSRSTGDISRKYEFKQHDPQDPDPAK